MDDNVMLLLGEMRGKLGELVHTMGNEVMERRIVVEKLQKLEGVPERLSQIEAELKSLMLKHAEAGGIVKGMEALRRWAPTLVTTLIGTTFLFKAGILHL